MKKYCYLLLLLLFTSRIVIAQSSVTDKQLLAAIQLVEDSKFKEALPKLQVIEQGIQLLNTYDQAELKRQIGICFIYTDQSRKAIPYLQSSADMWASLKIPKLQYRTRSFLADAYNNIDEDKKAYVIAKESLAYYQSVKDSSGMVQEGLSLGYSCNKLKMYKEAVDIYLFIEPIAAVHRPQNLGVVYNQLGNIFADEFKDHRRALAYYQKSLEYKIQYKATDMSISNAYNNIGLEYKGLKDTTNAIYNYQLAKQYAEKANNAIGIVRPLNNLGNIFKASKQYAKATEVLREALRYQSRIPESLQITVMYTLASVFADYRTPDSTIHYGNLALQLIRKLNKVNEEVLTRKLLADAYVQKQDLSKAYHEIAAYSALADSINAAKNQQEYANILVKYETVEKERQLLVAKQEVEQQKQANQLLSLSKELAIKESNAKIQALALEQQKMATEKAEISLKAANDSLLSNRKIIQQQSLLFEANEQNAINNKRIQSQRYLLIATAVLLCFAGLLIYFLRKQKRNIQIQNQLSLALAQKEALTKLQDERIRISRELHDNIGSHLTLINATVEQMPCTNVEDITPQLATVKSSLLMSMKELRRTVWLMNNSSVSLEEFVIRLRDYVKPVLQSNTKITVACTEGFEIKLTELATSHLFRIIQEAVNNALKYAAASTIEVELKAVDQSIFFSVKDDGVGFDTNQPGGNGLTNMQYRVKDLGGQLSISSKPSSGTIVQGTFPVQNR